jgi:hypothetical protein
VIATLTVDGEISATLAVAVSRGVISTGHIVAADTCTASERLLRIADVISAGHHPGGWLDRYPGCAVAISREFAATRAGSVDIRNRDPMTAGLFLHAWLAAGYPIGPLAGGEIRECGRTTRGERVTPFWVTIEVR